jgi:hypothetical protein
MSMLFLLTLKPVDSLPQSSLRAVIWTCFRMTSLSVIT